MIYLQKNKIEYLQIDHNSSCNLLCPQCIRTCDNIVNPSLPIRELQIDQYKKFINQLPNLKNIMFCGNYGDVIVSRTFIECLKYILSKTSAKIIITTNGSARNKKWWVDLALLLRNRGKVNFSIDGLEDTNHLYRVNSNFNKIIENAKAFIDAGGIARWDYLVFKHNEHQIKEAEQLAKEIGFKQFQLKFTNRFIDNRQYTQQNIKLRNNDTIDISTKENFKASGYKQQQKIIKKYQNWSNYVDHTKINCKWRMGKQIFIDFEARVWPCTWVAGGVYHYGKNIQKEQIYKLYTLYGKNFNSLFYFSLEDILNNQFYKNDLCQSWNSTINDKYNPKLLVCGRTCGTEYEFSSAYGKNKKIINLDNNFI